MSLSHPSARLEDSSSGSDLYRAANDGREDDVKAILASALGDDGLLNRAESVNDWTPLFVACVNGHLSIVELLLEAGVKHGLCDRAGWTEIEHAAYKGHMKVAELLAAANMAGKCRALE